jgi:hypothetical protein
MSRDPLTHADVSTGMFKRSLGSVVWLAHEGPGGWRLRDDVGALGGDPALGNPVADRISGPVRWALGCYTGAAMRPFALADIESGSESDRADALRLLWDLQLIDKA